MRKATNRHKFQERSSRRLRTECVPIERSRSRTYSRLDWPAYRVCKLPRWGAGPEHFDCKVERAGEKTHDIVGKFAFFRGILGPLATAGWSQRASSDASAGSRASIRADE